MNFLPLLRRLSRLLGCLALGWVGLVQAQDTAPMDALLSDAQRWIDAALVQSERAEAAPLRMQVNLGQLDTRLRLAPCSRIEPYLPANTRLWGKTRIGLRCLQGSTRWNVFLPVTVQAFGSAWLLRSPVAAGSVLRADDALQGEVDWATENSPVLADPALWVGQVAAYSLQAGQTLRQVMVRPVQVFQAGAPLRVLAQGAGFSVSADAQSLSAGSVGQQVRVRTEAGRVVSGVVLDARTVKIDL